MRYKCHVSSCFLLSQKHHVFGTYNIYVVQALHKLKFKHAKSDENLQRLYQFNCDVEVWKTNRSVTQLFVLWQICPEWVVGGHTQLLVFSPSHSISSLPLHTLGNARKEQSFTECLFCNDKTYRMSVLYHYWRPNSCSLSCRDYCWTQHIPMGEDS